MGAKALVPDIKETKGFFLKLKYLLVIFNFNKFEGSLSTLVKTLLLALISGRTFI